MNGRRGPQGSSSSRKTANGESLESLGRQIDSGDAAPTNDDGLENLGREIDAKRVGGTSGKRRRHRVRRIALISTMALVILVVGIAAGGYVYGYFQFKKLQNASFCKGAVCKAEVPNKPFNVLAIGSDSRAGLPPSIARVTGGGSVTGQRSDVVKIFHVDPQAGTISVVSIPRDTMVTLLANQNLFGRFNRVNVNYQNGPALLAKTIEANFGIPINHIVQVGFGGLAGAVNALGGVYMDFPYPALDVYSSLNIHHPGCQLLNGFMALAVARSRHYQYEVNGVWNYDGTSDFGRIDQIGR